MNFMKLPGLYIKHSQRYHKHCTPITYILMLALCSCLSAPVMLMGMLPLSFPTTSATVRVYTPPLFAVAPVCSM